jgi:hypothetical protein
VFFARALFLASGIGIDCAASQDDRLGRVHCARSCWFATVASTKVQLAQTQPVQQATLDVRMQRAAARHASEDQPFSNCIDQPQADIVPFIE